MIRTALTLAAVLVVSFILTPTLVWPSENWALAMMAVDALAATVILFHPAGKAQSLIGLTYLLQIGVHAGRLMNGDQADFWLYWLSLSILAFLQLLILGGWWINERAPWGRPVRRGGTLADPAYLESMER